MTRPTGVTILAMLQSIMGVLTVIGGLGLLAFGYNSSPEVLAQHPELQEAFRQIPPETLKPTMIGSGIFVIALGLIGLLIAWGLFKLKGWAWLTTLIFQGLGILGNLSNLATGRNPGNAVLQLVISGVVIYYLLRPNVKRAFGKV